MSELSEEPAEPAFKSAALTDLIREVIGNSLGHGEPSSVIAARVATALLPALDRTGSQISDADLLALETSGQVHALRSLADDWESGEVGTEDMRTLIRERADRIERS